MTLFDLPAPPPPQEPEPVSDPQPAGRCRRCKRLIRDPVSLGYQIGPDCRHRLGIDPPKKPRRFSVRWSGPVKDQIDLLKIDERGDMSYDTANLSRIEEEIRAERARQDAKWGEQNHPDGTRRGGDGDGARLAQQVACRAAAAENSLTWRHILTKELAEAYAENEPAAIRRELVQVAAVAVAWIEAIDRRETAGEDR